MSNLSADSHLTSGSLIEVEPMLDELAAAHEGLRMALAGCSSRSEHLQRMRAEITAENPGEIPRLHLLAMVSGMDASAYALAHSMLASQRVAVCNHCIDEDLSRHPYSWFRRSHHLIGVDWCRWNGNVDSKGQSVGAAAPGSRHNVSDPPGWAVAFFRGIGKYL